jgi:hypothetical protein
VSQAESNVIDFASRRNPDRKLIDVCMRIYTLNCQIDDLHAHDYDQDTIDELAAPLSNEWFVVIKRLFKLKPPTTLEGAQAAALCLLANLASEELEMAKQDEDPVLWLSIGVARFLVAGNPANAA